MQKKIEQNNVFNIVKKYIINSFKIIPLPFLFVLNNSQAQQKYFFYSPDSTIKVSVYSGKKIMYSIEKDKKTIFSDNPISMTLSDLVLGQNEKIVSTKISNKKDEIKCKIGKRAVIKNEYNEFEMNFEKKFTLVFRLYNNAFSYRFKTNLNKEIIVLNEEAGVRMPENYDFYFHEDLNYESFYELKDFFSVDPKSPIMLPLLIQSKSKNPTSLAMFTEADLQDYPSLMFKKSGDWLTNFDSYFVKYPIEFKPGGYLNYTPMASKTTDYIAKTNGTRSFPWRVILFPKSEKELLDNDIVYSLNRPSATNQNFDWVQSGLCVWEYWHNLNLSGVDFKTGQNTKTYLYYLNFAADNKIPYMVIDWKWSNEFDLFQLNDNIDVREIIKVAKSKNVKIVLWVLAHTVYEDLEKKLDFVKSLGASGIKVDFFDRDDQLSNQMYEKIASECAKRELIVDFHGCSKPTGLQRTYPNILNYEAVKGNETNLFSNKPTTPKHHLQCAYIRGAIGPLDFTPGGLKNVTLKEYKPSGNLPMQVGTRMHHLSMFVVYEAGLQMLCDAPTNYVKFPDLLRLISKIPTSWDETIVLEAKINENLCVARKKNNEWYVAGMSEEEMVFDLKFNFLENGKYEMSVFEDGVNSDKSPEDYFTKVVEISDKTTLKQKVAVNGGFILKITKK